MYLRTRLLLGIAVVTLVALAISLIVPLTSVRGDVSRETESSTQLARLLHDIDNSILTASASTTALGAAAKEIRSSAPLRHVKVMLIDANGTAIATSPTDVRQGGWLARRLLSSESSATLTYPMSFRGAPFAQLRVLSNPQSEIDEIEQRVFRDLALLALTILTMAASIYLMVSRGLMPVAQIQSALTRLEAGELDTRLPQFKLKDLDDISQRFNHCAAVMQETAAQRRALTRRLIDVAEDERKRLARELHDELGQSLTAIKVDAAYIAREAAGSSAKIETCARGVEKLTGDIMEIIRGMLARLRPHGLETVGLRETLQELVNGWQARISAKFRCSLTFTGPVDSLPPDLTISVYRLIQECLTNAVRYSRARAIAIQLTVTAAQATPELPEQVSLSVQESEMATDVPVEESSRESGSGILGMRERVEAHGGEFRVTIRESGGMSLQARMPVLLQDGSIVA